MPYFKFWNSNHVQHRNDRERGYGSEKNGAQSTPRTNGEASNLRQLAELMLANERLPRGELEDFIQRRAAAHVESGPSIAQGVKLVCPSCNPHRFPTTTPTRVRLLLLIRGCCSVLSVWCWPLTLHSLSPLLSRPRPCNTSPGFILASVALVFPLLRHFCHLGFPLTKTLLSPMFSLY
jgi:hypothetical protein